MSVNNLNSVEWLIEQIKQDQKYQALSKKEWEKVFDKAFELHLDDIEFHYDQGYAEGYKRALELVQWAIEQVKTKHK
jgi:hypothetical protein